VEVVVAGDGAGADPARLKRELAARGHTRLLTEGGPRLLGQLAAADVLDELCLTYAPRYAVGAASRVMTGPELAVPRDLTLAGLLEEDGFLFARYHRAGR
jgi:5-amino-6-(5-phosphoribosylamino)uracil reductase